MASPNRIDVALKAAKDAGKVAYIPYITSGFPTKEDTVPMLLGMQEAGADIIELGIPFSDPLADGPTIQRANQAALLNGVTLRDSVEYVREARSKGLTVPVILMGYLNPICAIGEAAFVELCKDAGVDGFIVVDLPPEEAATFVAACDAHGLYFIPLVAPTTTDERLEEVAKRAKGYVYCVSITGITGARAALPEHLGAFVERVRRHVSLPIAVGFGLSTRDHVVAVSHIADAAIMGSSIVKAAEKGDDVSARVQSVASFIKSVLP